MKRSTTCSRPLRRLWTPTTIYVKRLLVIVGSLASIQSAQSQTNYTWNGMVSTSWNVPGNWTPAGVPGPADNVTIVTAGNSCTMSGAVNIANFKLTNGTLDLGGFTLTAGGTTGIFTAGTVQNGTLTVTGAATTTFGNGPLIMNCIVNINSAAVSLKNTTFQKTTTIVKTGASNDGSGGGNVFNSAVTITNAGAGYLLLGNGAPDQFNAASTFNNTGSATLYVAYNSTGNIFGGLATFNNAPAASAGISVSQGSAGTLFNDDIAVSSSNGSGISFCNGSSTASATLAAGKKITAGGGFSAGTLLLRQFTQVGTLGQTLNLTGTGSLTLGPSSSFDGDLTAVTPTIFLNGCTFNGATSFTKTGSTGDWSAGGNIFNGACSIVNTGSSYFLLGNNAPDTWNADVTFTNSGSERILPCWSTAGNQFNGDIYVNTSGSAAGVQFCGGNTTATANLAAGKSVFAGLTGLTAGYLYLKQFTQAGDVPINLTATGTASVYLGPSSNFGGAVSITAPDIYAQGARYSRSAVFTKTGGTNNHNSQYQNIFDSTCTINQQSNTGYFMLGYNSNDLFAQDITVSSTGSGGIYLGWSSGTGTPTLALGKTIQVGTGGFSAGNLYLNTFTQLGSAPMNLTFTGASTSVRFARGTIIGGDLITNTPDIFFNGALFNGAVNVTRSGTGNDNCVGGNTFQGVTTINNTGSGSITLANQLADTCNGDLFLNTSGSSYIGAGWNSAGNIFNGNITVTSTGSGPGVQFCANSGASAVQSAGHAILIGAGGFSSGTLLLRQFTQLGNTPTNLSLTGAATLCQVGPSSAFGGAFTVSSPRILLNGAVFSDTVTVTKTGATGEWSNGGNIFGSALVINHLGGGYFGFANGAPDIYNGDVYSNNNSTERIIFGNTPTGNQFNGNIILTQIGSSQGTAFGWSSNTDMTMAAGKTISIGGAGFNVGYLQIMRFTQLGNVPVSLPLTGTTSLTFGPSSTIGGDMSSTSASLFFSGCTFNGKVTSVKNGSTSDYSGNNVFNGVANITNAGSGPLVLGSGNPDQFNAAATFNNVGSANLHIAHNSSGNAFNGVTTFNNSPTGNNAIYVSQNSTGTVFNDSILVSSTNGAGVLFCNGNATATVTLAGHPISVGAAGFSSGTLLLRQFTQTGPALDSLLLTGTGNLTFGPLSGFGGDVVGSSPTLYLNGCTFDGVSTLTKTGVTGDWSVGGNVFNGVCTLTNTGSSYLLLGNTNPDIWNNDVTFTNSGAERILACWASAGNQFNGDIYVNTSGSATGITFCGGNTTATATLAASKTIKAGLTGLNSGYLILKQFTQLGFQSINLTLANTATYLQFGPSSALGGNVVSSSPGLYFQGCTFNGSATCTKTGPTNDQSNGNNVFNGVTTLTNTGSGYLMMANGNKDQFNTIATFTNKGSAHMYLAHNSSDNYFGGVTTFNNAPTANTLIYVSPYSTGTNFNDNIVVTSTSGQGVQFCSGNSTATATLASGRTITVGTDGFSSGTLLLRQFIQVGGKDQALTLTGTGNLTFGPQSNFGGDMTTVSPTLYFNGCTFNGLVSSVKNGVTSDASSGNNLFVGAFSITNTGAGYFMMGNGNPDTWMSSATFSNYSSASHLYTAYNSTGNVFNGDVIYNNQPGAAGLWIYPNQYGVNCQYNGNISVVNVNGGGIYFGNGTGNSTLASGKSISVGSGGFASGGLVLRRFTQSGSGTAQNIVSTGSSYVQYGPNSSFDGPVTSSSPGLLYNGAVFNGTVNGTKTGSSNDQSAGGNTFNGTSTFTDNGTGYLMMTNSTADAYNGNVSFVQVSTGPVYPNYNNTSTYSGNVSVTSPSSAAITFGNGNGTAIFNGAGAQTINATAGTSAPIFSRLVIANTGSGVTLNNSSINVSKTLAMTSGLLHTSTTYILTMLNGSVTTPGNALSTSYVNGPMRYQKSSSGVSTLNFPIGNNPDCRPIVLTVNHANGTLYTYEAKLYNASARGLAWAPPPTVDHVSDVHYYTITRVNSAGVVQPTKDLSGNQMIQLFYGSNDIVTNGATLTVCKNTYLVPNKWIDIGGNGGPVYTGANLIGSVTSTNMPTAFNSFSTFALGDVMGGGNVLPTELLFFHAKPDNDLVNLTWATTQESNNSFFTVERSKDGVSYEALEKVPTAAPHGNSSGRLDYRTQDLHPYAGTSYYRLKQTDLDGTYHYSAIEVVNFDKPAVVSIYPNPTKGTIYIKGIDVNQTSVRIEWYDLGGRLLSQGTVPASYGIAKVDANYNNGIYLLKVILSDGTFKLQNVIFLK